MVEFSTNDAPVQDLADAPSRVMPLSEVDDFEVADGYPEIRGWDVRDSGGRSIGYVYDLLVDVEALRVRYLDVELDPEFAGADADRRVLIPLENVGLDGGREDIVLHIDAAEVRALVPYARRGVAREQEVSLAPMPGLADVGPPMPAAVEAELPRERHYDDERFFGRDSETDLLAELAAVSRPELASRVEEARPIDATPLAPSEFSLADVTVRTTVETERAREHVTADREEVEIERRPLRPGEQLTAPDVQSDEIRIPIMAEELVIEKRLVAKEVLIIRKRRVAEQRTVEADLRREEVHVDDPLARVRALGEAAGGPEGRA